MGMLILYQQKLTLLDTFSLFSHDILLVSTLFEGDIPCKPYMSSQLEGALPDDAFFLPG